MDKYAARNILLIFGLALLAMLPMFLWGVTFGNDMTQHFQFAAEVYRSVNSGVIYPGFSAGVNDGFGDVGLRFYPPLTYYVLAGLFLIFGDWYVAALVCFFLIFAFSGLGVYLWANTKFSPPQALIAAGIFTFAPYHVSLIYNNFLLAEFAATAVFPFCFYFVARVCRRGSFSDMVGLAVSYAFLVLTHLPSTIIISICLVLYALFLLERAKVFESFWRLGSAALAGLLASSFYWSRMLPEMEWLQHSSAEYFRDTFDYSANFLLHPRNIINLHDDTLSLWLADLMLVSTILLIIPAAYLLITKTVPRSKFTLAALTLFAFGVLMVSPLSQPIWDNAPFLQKVQFPWRFMGIISALGAIIASIGVYYLSQQATLNIAPSVAVGSILLLFVFVSAFLIKGAVYKPRTEFLTQIDHLSTGDSYVGWWPVWAKRSGRNMTERITAGERAVQLHSWNALERTFSIEPGPMADVHIRTYYYPHWEVFRDGVQTTVFPDDNGLITFAIGPDPTPVTLKFEEPLRVKAASLVSAGIWISFLITFMLLALRANLRAPAHAVRI